MSMHIMSFFTRHAVSIVVILIGICLSSPALYQRLISLTHPIGVGLIPATHYGLAYEYTLEELSQANLTGQLAIVTGANAGIGYQLTLGLVRQGAEVVMACRNPTKCDEAADRMRQDERFQGKAVPMIVDTSSLRSVKAFAELFQRTYSERGLDMLFLNAGMLWGDTSRDCIPLSEDGIELVFATNYVGHHLMYRLLEPMLRRAKIARVVQTTSVASFAPYSYKVATDLDTLNGCREDYRRKIMPFIDKSYSQSKLAQVVWTKAIAQRLGSDSNIYVNCFNPGGVATEIFHKALGQHDSLLAEIMAVVAYWFNRIFLWSPPEGALTGHYLGVAVDRLVREQVRGKYFCPQAQEVDHHLARDIELGGKLLKFSDDLVQEFL